MNQPSKSRNNRIQMPSSEATSTVLLLLQIISDIDTESSSNPLCRAYLQRETLGDSAVVPAVAMDHPSASTPSSSSSSPFSSTTQPVMFYDFLDRMRNPASVDLVRSIKSFIVSFSFYPANPEIDGKRVQEFFSTMEATIREHPVWAAANDDEIDSAMEGLEKYVMTKLFTRTFASTPEDLKIDQEISAKICLLQTFLKPEHLDIPMVLRNEASWLLAEKELMKINTVRAPRDKLLCIMNCCKVINNLLLNASMSENTELAGADNFLPVVIYVMIKANPPQLHSNLKFIQLFRRQSKLVSAEAYYFTNLVSAKTFVVDLNAKSLSMDETEFEESMKAARLANRVLPVEDLLTSNNINALGDPRDPGPLGRIRDEINTSGGHNYPYMDAEAGDLTVGDVGRLLSLYKDVVSKYTNLCRTVRHSSVTNVLSIPRLEGDSVLLARPDVKSASVDQNKGDGIGLGTGLAGSSTTTTTTNVEWLKSPTTTTNDLEWLKSPITTINDQEWLNHINLD